MGSIGAAGMQFYVYAPDGVTRISKGDARSLSGKLEGNTLTLTGRNDPALLNALVAGGRVRMNNRALLAGCFYPRHSVLDNGNPAYNQYRNSDGTPKYAQRSVQTAYLANIRSLKTSWIPHLIRTWRHSTPAKSLKRWGQHKPTACFGFIITRTRRTALSA